MLVRLVRWWIVAMISATAGGQTDSAVCRQEAVLGRYELGSRPDALDVDGNIAYVSEAGFGLRVLDVSNPTAVNEVGSLRLVIGASSGGFAAVESVGDLVFLAGRSFGLFIVDVSDPASPVLLSNVETGRQVLGFDLVGDLVYVAESFFGLRILDISDPSAPHDVGRYQTPQQAYDVEVVDSIAFVADNFSGLQVIDVSEPASPTRISSLAPWSQTTAIEIVGDFAFLGEGFGVRVVDITDPSRVEPIVAAETRSIGPRWIHYEDGRLFVSEDRSGLAMFDVTDPSRLRFTARYAGPADIRYSAAAGPVAYASCPTGSLVILDATRELGDSTIGFAPVVTQPFDLTLVDDIAYVASCAGRLEIVDVANRSAPRGLGLVEMGGCLRGVAFEDGLVYLVDRDEGFYVVDVSDPTKAHLIGTGPEQPVRGNAVASENRFAYIAAFSDGLFIIDASDIDRMTLIESFDTPGDAYDVLVRDGLAYVADGESGIAIIDVSDPTSPTLVGSHPGTSQAIDLALAGDTLLVADSEGGLLSFDVSDPASPRLLSVFELFALGGQKITVDGQTGFFVASGRLFVLDLSDPASPAMLGLATYAGRIRDIAPLDAGTLLATNQFEAITIDVRQDCRACTADIDADGDTDTDDLFAWIAALKLGSPECDVNRDGDCGSPDFFAWVSAFGQGCG